MHFQTSSKELSTALLKAYTVIKPNPVLPITEDYLLELKGNNLSITSTNMEATIKTSLEVFGKEDGTCCIPAKGITETLKLLPDQPIDLRKEGSQLILTSNNGKFENAIDDHSDFPQSPEVENDEIIELESDLLLKAINDVMFCASNDELRAAMNGLYFSCVGGKITFVATDAHRLALISQDNEDSLDFEFIVDKSVLKPLKSLLESGTQVNMIVNDKNILIASDKFEFIGRMVDATYPEYKQIMPSGYTKKAIVSKSSLKGSLKRVVMYTNTSTNAVVIKMDSNSLAISGSDIEFSKTGSENISCEYENEAITISVNGKFLDDCLSHISSDNVEVHMGQANQAIILKGEEDKYNSEMLLMPILQTA